MLRDSFLEHAVCFLFQDTEAGELRRGPILFVEACEIKTFMMGKRVVRDHLRGCPLAWCGSQNTVA